MALPWPAEYVAAAFWRRCIAFASGHPAYATADLWTTSFNNGEGWNESRYTTTMMFADINGDGKADVCGRGGAGIWCALSAGIVTTVREGFDTAFLAQTDFSNANGWDQSAYYPSLRFADVNGDGRPDICGRGALGVYCALSTRWGGF